MSKLNKKALEAARVAFHGTNIQGPRIEEAIRTYLRESGIGAVLALLPEWATASYETHSGPQLSDLVGRLEKAVVAMSHPLAALEERS